MSGFDPPGLSNGLIENIGQLPVSNGGPKLVKDPFLPGIARRFGFIFKRLRIVVTVNLSFDTESG